MEMPARYSTFLNESLQKQKKNPTQLYISQGRRFMGRNFIRKIFC